MRKKLFVIGTCFTFLLFVANRSFGQDNQISGEMTIASPSPVMTITPTPDYVMPYPGLLPDSPLYIFKAIRDKVISIMIGDSLKKAQFDLLQSDKRIGASVILFEKGNKEQQILAISTVSKGQNYYEDAIQKLEEAKKQGAGVENTVTLMKRASIQYVYQLKKVKKKVSKPIAAQIDTLVARSLLLQKKINSF